MNTHRALISALLLPVLALTGCSTVEPGSPTAVDSADDSGAPSTSGSSTSQTMPDACAIMEKVADQFSLTNLKGSREGDCGGDLPEVQSVGITFHLNLGVDQYKPNPQSVVSDITVNGRRAKMAEKALTKFDCAVAIELTKTSRVDVFASASLTGDPCPLAQQFATAIEPELPRS